MQSVTVAAYRGNRMQSVTEEDVGVLTESLNNLKIFSSVIDKLEMIQNGVVVTKMSLKPIGSESKRNSPTTSSNCKPYRYTFFLFSRILL